MESTDPEQVKIWSLESKGCLCTAVEKKHIDLMIIDPKADILVMTNQTNIVVSNNCSFILCTPYAMKVMTSFGYEIMLPRGFWFQTLDVNKPWRQIPADRLLVFWCSHIFLSDYPKAIRRGEISFKSNHVIERNFEAANSRIN